MAGQISRLTRFEGTDQSVEHGGVGEKLNELIDALNGMVTGQATIAAASASVTVLAATLGGLYGGSPVMATLNTVDGTLTQLLSAEWSSNDLVLTGNAAATGDVVVTYQVDTRA